MAIDRETQVLTDAYAAGIRSPRELANFMAHVTHESNGLNRLEESFRYTRDITQVPTPSAWREGTATLDAARRDALQGNPEKLADLMYGGRNGNDKPGDGWTYHGRGYLPINGKDNYEAAGKALGVDLVGKPELAAEPATASKIAAWHWQAKVPEAAREDVRASTQALNGRLNGLEDREKRFTDWQRRLTPEVMDRLAQAQAGPRLDDAAHPDHGLYSQARSAVHALDARHGRTPDQQSDQLAGSLTVQAKREGLTGIDHVVLSDDARHAWAVQGELDSPHKRMAQVATADAVHTPLAQSTADMERVNAAQQQTQPQNDPQQQQAPHAKPPGH
jgi:putative chitinase